MRYNHRTGEASIVTNEEHFRFGMSFSVQLGVHLYSMAYLDIKSFFQNGPIGTPSLENTFIRYSDLESEEPVKVRLSSPRHFNPVGGAQMTVYGKHSIYIVGGRTMEPSLIIFNLIQPRKEMETVEARCERYDIASNEWFRAPELNEARYANSTCVLGKHLYTFFGLHRASCTKEREPEDVQCRESIERLDAQADISGRTEWTLIKVNMGNLAWQFSCEVFSISESEVLFFGGISNSERPSKWGTCKFNVAT